MKPGIQTTEFWMTVILVVVGAVLTAIGGVVGNDTLTAVGGAVVALTGTGYTVSRGAVKMFADDKID